MRKLLLAILLSVLPALASAQQSVRICAEAPNSPACVSSLNPIATASAVESSRTLKASNGTLTGFQANNTNAASRWILLFDAASVPSDGTVTGCNTVAATRPCVMKWYQIGANSTIGVSWAPGPFPIFQSGMILVCSSTGPFTKTATADCTFSGEAQ
jgi:hypothetical protein